MATNELARLNQQRRQEIQAVVQRRRAAHGTTALPGFLEYPLAALEQRLSRTLSERRQEEAIVVKLQLTERARFGGDIALKLPQLLRDGGPERFIKEHLPWVLEALRGPEFAEIFSSVEPSGMYINLRVTDGWFLESAQVVADLGQAFGQSDALRDRTVVVDYSSPNVAKVLHAGHIRSTIVGHVLSNLLEACGALVYRINHINDFGGFGFMLEGYRRFADKFPVELSDNQRLLEVYRVRRTVERVLEREEPLDKLDSDEGAMVARYFPGATSWEALKAAFADYVRVSDERLAALEAGAECEVQLWREMVKWSLADFERFYAALNVQFELVIGESFYLDAGNSLIERCLRDGKALVYTTGDAERDVAAVEGRAASGEITAAECENLSRSIRKDVGAVVVPLDGGERLVVRRADGRSIYATRDLGAVALRREIFDPTHLVYVVGQEQRIHFDRLFRASYQVGIVTPEQLHFQHVYFGFYIDAKNRKKLSSRETVANVTSMLEEATKYFRTRLSERVEKNSDELARAARELAVGSIVFNDLKQDIRGAVEIDSHDVRSTIKGFEDAGGAYVVYAACRARSILRRLGHKPHPWRECGEAGLDHQEVELLLQVLQMPQRTAAAALQSNPSILVRHLLELATTYNSYYARVPVFVDGVGDPVRLLLTQAVHVALTNGLAFCHVECPQVI